MTIEILKVSYKTKRCISCDRVLPSNSFHLYREGRLDTCIECESRAKLEKDSVQRLVSLILN